MIRELNLQELLEVLKELDAKLGEHTIEIRAVGDFALSWRGVRNEGLTADIDTLTNDYPQAVRDIIAEVGVNNGLEPWWLNNDVAADDAAFIDEALDLRWDLVDAGLSKITLYIASLDSLLALKLSALEDSRLSGRAHDLDDAINILLALGHSKESFRKKFAYLQDTQPYAYKLITGALW